MQAKYGELFSILDDRVKEGIKADNLDELRNIRSLNEVFNDI